MEWIISRLRQGLWVLLLLVSASCATTGNYEKVLTTWVGVDANTLVTAWGPPRKTYTLPGGGKIIEYQDPKAIPFGGARYYAAVAGRGSGNTLSRNPEDTRQEFLSPATAPYEPGLECKARFTIDGFGVVSNWGWEGNNCRAFPPDVDAEVLVSGRTPHPMEKEKRISDARAPGLDARDSLSVNTLGYLHEGAGRRDAAIDKYGESCRMGYQPACENYRRLAGAYPRDIHRRTAELLEESRNAFLKGDWDGVIRKTTEALRLTPKSEIALVSRAGAYANKGMLAEAREDCDAAIKLNPDYGLAYNNSGYVYELQGQAKRAGLDYEIGCSLGSAKACENLKRLSEKPRTAPKEGGKKTGKGQGI